MTTIVQVVATKGASLRTRIVKDRRLEKFLLEVAEEKRSTRKEGWAKIRGMDGIQGAINIQWDQDSRILVCRVVNKLGGKPHSIIGAFVDYLLARQKGRVQSIQIITR